jgi:hypothetical protein
MLLRSKGLLFGTAGSALAALATAVALSAPPALADSVPDPGSPGSHAFLAFSPSTFANPPAATRVKFRWWQRGAHRPSPIPT